MDIELLKVRAKLFRDVRSFFDARGYLEVDTPLLAPGLIPESCLEVFETEQIPPKGSRASQSPGGGRRKLWLIPSPEIWMKKIIAQHRASIYQICHCFRNGEQTGRIHSPEFTMLEWYTVGADYLDSLALAEEFLNALFPEPINIERITMEDAFSRWSAVPLAEIAASPEPGPLFDLAFIRDVEPALPKDRFVALLDYPAFIPCLARKKEVSHKAHKGTKEDTKVLGGGKGARHKQAALAASTITSLLSRSEATHHFFERWELYYKGIELANCYSEESDPGEVRRFFGAEAAAKAEKALVRHAVDPDYWKIFADFPQCSGVAMGLDRLLMAVLGKSAIDSVLPFANWGGKS
jgi:lysyl-tRNA synthetase class 2